MFKWRSLHVFALGHLRRDLAPSVFIEGEIAVNREATAQLTVDDE